MSGSANRSNGSHLVLGRASLLAALIAALAAILLGTTASASATVGAENRVGAFNVAGEVLVGPPEHVIAGQRLGEAAPQLDFVVATGVAAESAPTVTMTERLAPHPVKPSEARDRWNDFLGPGAHTNIHPRTGVADPNRIVSADGRRSIRFGQQEMNSSPTKFHYHEETWSFDPGANAWQVDNLLVRVPFPKGAW